jgi:hypothetical protein
MLNMPDQTFTFTISNLSEDMINFNILHTPHRVSAENPGPSYGINEVNELRPHQSYTIAADQRNNRRMSLIGKTTTINDPETSMEKQVAVTVKQSEADPDKPTGLYFYLSVVPDVSCKSLVDKFAEGTVWKVSTGFVRRVARPPQETFVHAHGFDIGETNRKYLSQRRIWRGECPTCGNRTHKIDMVGKKTPLTVEGVCIHGRCLLCHPLEGYQSRPELAPASEPGLMRPGRDIIVDDDDDSVISGLTMDLALLNTQPGSMREWHPEFGQVNDDDDFEEPPPIRRPRRHGENSVCGDADMAPPPGPNQGLNTQSGSMRDWRPEFGQVNEEVDVEVSPEPSVCGDADSMIPPHYFEFAEPCKSKTAPRRAAEAHFVAPVDVGTTQAGALTYGEHVDGHDYAYEHSSEPTVLCMSIWEDMKFLALSNSVEDELAAEVKEWLENEGRALIASLNAIFKTEICVIDQESEADTIVCTCGHQCLNHANVRNELRKCPICRSPITAFVRADGIMLE